MDISFQHLNHKTLTRALEIAADQHNRAATKAKQHFGPESAAAQEIAGLEAALRAEIININQLKLPITTEPKKK